jgi:predicted nucleotidyltransferase
MTRDEVLSKLRDLKPWLRARGITRVRLYGSYARDEAREDSDVDLIVEFSRVPDLWEFASIREALIERLGVSVDLVTERALHEKLRERIVSSAVDA